MCSRCGAYTHSWRRRLARQCVGLATQARATGATYLRRVSRGFHPARPGAAWDFGQRRPQATHNANTADNTMHVTEVARVADIEVRRRLALAGHDAPIAKRFCAVPCESERAARPCIADNAAQPFKRLRCKTDPVDVQRQCHMSPGSSASVVAPIVGHSHSAAILAWDLSSSSSS